jgi:hypothetical protein
MSGKRILLLLAAIGLLWFAFFRKRTPVPVVVNQGIDPATGRVVGTSENITATANQAVANTIGAAGNAAAAGTSQILGTIFGGIATSIAQYGQGGSNGADTASANSSADWFSSSDSYDSGAYSDYAGIDTSL